MAGLLCARQYFDRADPTEAELRQRIGWIWNDVEWRWHTKEGTEDVLYWHWSPNNGWSMNHPVRGWNECLITTAPASSPRYAIGPEVYHRGWTGGPVFRNGKTFYGVELPLGPDLGGPLFFAHYSFLFLDPRGLRDRYADYWRQNVAHALINHRYCVDNPKGWQGYGPGCWGLTASDNPEGYHAHAPGPEDDRGVISPTAAIASLPYVPELSLRALRHFHGPLRDRLWGEYGFPRRVQRDAGLVRQLPPRHRSPSGPSSRARSRAALGSGRAAVPTPASSGASRPSSASGPRARGREGGRSASG